MAPQLKTIRQRSRLNSLLWISFLVLVLSIGFMRPSVTVANRQIAPPDLIFPFVALLLFIAVCLRTARLGWDGSYLYFAAYFASMTLSSAFSAVPPANGVKLFGEAYLIGLAIVTLNLADTDSRIKHVVIAWLIATIATIAIAVVAICLYYFLPGHWLLEYTTYHFGSVPLIDFPRISSTFVSASLFCNYLNVSIFLAFVAKEKGWIAPRAFVVILSLIVLAAISTLSIGIGGVLLAVGICYWITDRARHPSAAKISLAAGIVIAAAAYASSFFAFQYHPTAPYAINVPLTNMTIYPSARLMVWTESWETFANDPVTGKGLDQTACAVTFQNSDGSYSLLTDAHNIYLSVAAQNGILGLISILGLSVFILWRGASITDLTTRLFAAAFFTAFVYQGLTGAYEDARHLWVLIGLALAVSRGPSGI